MLWNGAVGQPLSYAKCDSFKWRDEGDWFFLNSTAVGFDPALSKGPCAARLTGGTKAARGSATSDTVEVTLSITQQAEPTYNCNI
jgi:hypothetical protein